MIYFGSTSLMYDNSVQVHCSLLLIRLNVVIGNILMYLQL